MMKVVILAGGSGARLWPLSRDDCPKQFLPLVGENPLLQQTVRRLDGLEEATRPIIVCNRAHRFLVAEQLRQLGQRPEIILLEPLGRSTAPALTLAALWLSETEPEDPLMLVTPADYVIQNVPSFHAALREGLESAKRGKLVTFGIVPTRAATGYGYIRRGAGGTVAQFTEKPDAATAQRYLETGDYFWNSGIFLLRASLWLAELQRYRPEIIQACRQAYRQGQREGDFFWAEPEAFSLSPSDSIDYAVMERTDHAVVVPLDAGWSDVGDWSSLQGAGAPDAAGNVLRGDVLCQDSRDSLLIAQSRLLAAVGLRDTIVVETPDAVLVAGKDHAQAVKLVVDQLKQAGRPEGQSQQQVRKPWGSYQVLVAGAGYQVKRIIVNPGAALSLQKHRQRAEHWVVVRGKAQVTRDQEVFRLEENQATDIPLGAIHRLENPGDEPLELIEVQSGDYLGEDDIVRLEDRYQRDSHE
ncbi:MAG TPA: mannose-1-phosphate guanylyltransferase/mannose-6-phosphate isomerase [Candidatus Fraserbacteria bacterium]|nr:mannose-1-phosphate guanylyltransferase/mannose-6-phosphate isomerase [Candidatus Fraserbacteria bacterium]